MHDHTSLFSDSSKAEIAFPLSGFSLESRETGPCLWNVVLIGDFQTIALKTQG
jgi:hypothetical protein